MQKKNYNNSIVEYEKALLGSIFTNPNSIEKIINFLIPEDFLDIKNKIIFIAMVDIWKKGFLIEIAPIIRYIKDKNQYEKIGGSDYLDFLITEAGLKSNIQKYMQKIVEDSQKRKIKFQIEKLKLEMEKTEFSSEEIIEKLEMNIFSNYKPHIYSDFKLIKEIVEKCLHEINQKALGKLNSGISSDFISLDKIIGGFKNGDLIILAARPSMGKTALALNIAVNIASKHKVGFFSIEMSSKQLVDRILGLLSFLSSHKINQPQYLKQSEWQKLKTASQKIKKLNLYLDDSPGIQLHELIWKARRLKKNVGLEILFIDYLQLITSKKTTLNRQIEVSNITRTLKQLARELDIPVVAIAQLSRRVEQRESKLPIMSDLRESGSIEQDADLITFLYREDYYKNKNNDNIKQKEIQEVQILISKHRNGPTGIVKLAWNQEFGLFLDKTEN